MIIFDSERKEQNEDEVRSELMELAVQKCLQEKFDEKKMEHYIDCAKMCEINRVQELIEELSAIKA